MPLDGSYTVSSEDVTPGQGAVIIRATYEDKGANGVPPARTTKIVQLDYPLIDGGTVIEEVDLNKLKFNAITILSGEKDGAMAGFDAIDLTQVAALNFRALASQRMGAKGGYIEVRIDSPEGKLIGTSDKIEASQGFGGPNAPPVRVPIQVTDGKHKIFIFYRNDDPVEGPLFSILQFSLEGVKPPAM